MSTNKEQSQQDREPLVPAATATAAAAAVTASLLPRGGEGENGRCPTTARPSCRDSPSVATRRSPPPAPPLLLPPSPLLPLPPHCPRDPTFRQQPQQLFPAGAARPFVTSRPAISARRLGSRLPSVAPLPLRLCRLPKLRRFAAPPFRLCLCSCSCAARLSRPRPNAR